MCHVGEWRGHTGDDGLTAALLRDFTLARRVAVPNWADTAHELTIWRRRHPYAAGGDEQPGQRGLVAEAGDSALSKVSEAGSQRDGPDAADDLPAERLHNGRGIEAAARGQSEPLQCWTCGEEQSGTEPGARARGAASRAESAGHGLRRCRYCRDAAFCTAECAAEGEGLHRQAHALRLIFFNDYRPEFSSDPDYEPVPLL